VSGRPYLSSWTGVVTPDTPRPRISVLTGCRVSARAHLYAGARYIVVRGLGLECSKRLIPSEYRGPMHGCEFGLLRITLPRTRVYKGTEEEGPRQSVLNLSRPSRASISACFTCGPRLGIRKRSGVVCVRLETGGSMQAYGDLFEDTRVANVCCREHYRQWNSPSAELRWRFVPFFPLSVGFAPVLALPSWR